MNDALELLYLIYDKFLNFIFGAYIFEGVSIGMIFVTSFVFIVLLRFLVAIPRVHVGSEAKVDQEMREARLSSYRASADYYKSRTR